MNETCEFLATIGATGLILMLFVSAFKNKRSPDAIIIFMLLLEGQTFLAHAFAEVLTHQDWAAFEVRKFICAAAAYTPGVLALRLIYRWALESGPVKEAVSS